MPFYRITCAEEASVNYFLTAKDEDEAHELLMRGEFDDYDTIGSSILQVVEVTEIAP